MKTFHINLCVKVFCDIIRIVSVSLGAVIGAGFISGRELIGFFGTDGYIISLIVMGIFVFISFSILFILGRRFKKVGMLNLAITKSGKTFDFAVYISSFISVCGLIAVLDGLWQGIGLTANVPILSIVVLIALYFVSSKGIKGVEIVSVAIVPIILIAINILIFSNGKLNFENVSYETGHIFKAFLYVSMNCFINLPALVDVAYKKNKKACFISALIVALMLVIQSYIILTVIDNTGEIAINSSMPLYAVLGGDTYGGVYSLCLLSAVLTSLVSAYYPLYEMAKKKAGRLGALLLAVAVFTFSRLGFKNIVDYAYPIIGAFGTLYLIKCIIFLLKDKKKNKNGKRKRYQRTGGFAKGKDEKSKKKSLV